MKNIYIVTSFTNTLPGKAIKLRASAKFWNRYPGDNYSHVSLSRDSKLGNMMSFARKEIKNPLNSGMIKEDIRTGMFALNSETSKMAVMEFKVSERQYDTLSTNMERYWEERDKYGFNYAGLFTMLLYARGVEPKNKFFCSQWVTTVLQESGIELFENRKPKDVRPFDVYGKLKNNIIYEGLVKEYPEYDNCSVVQYESESNEINYREKQLIRRKI